MDSKERHELKQNDLYVFITHFKAWWSKNGTVTITTIIIFIVAVYIGHWYQTKDKVKLEKAWTQLAQAQSTDHRLMVAANYPNLHGLTNKARLEAADDLLRKIALLPPTTDQAVGDQSLLTAISDRDRNLTNAQKIYQLILDDENAQRIFVLNARIGLAAIDECLGQFDKATEQYKTIQKLAVANDLSPRYSAIAHLADRRLANLNLISKNVTITPATDEQTQAENPQSDDATTKP